MSKYVLLNNIDHKDLKIKTDFVPEYGDNEMIAMTFPQEFRSIQAEYPIFFRKDEETGKFLAVALLGLRENENLFLTDTGWDASYVPLSVKRRPFLIGTQPNQSNGEPQMMVYIDKDSPRVNHTEGEPVFLAYGGYTPYLESIISVLDYIWAGSETCEQLVAFLLKHNLLSSVELEIELHDGTQNQLLGFYTIDEEKLQSLNEQAALEIHTKGYAMYIYMMLASVSQVPQLIKKFEARHGISPRTK